MVYKACGKIFKCKNNSKQKRVLIGQGVYNMVTLHGRLFKGLDFFWENLRKFFYNHKTLFDIFFVGLYSVEQLVFFVLILIIPKYSSIFAGIFAIIFITTISFEKKCMESRYNELQNQITIAEIRSMQIQQEYNKIKEENKNLVKYLKEISR